MAVICNCDTGLGNTGQTNCQNIQDVTKRIWLVPIYANDGTLNKILSTDVLNQAFFDAKVNHSDVSKRWFPLPNIENIEDLRGDTVFETLNSGENLFVQQGIATFAGVLVNGSPEYLGKLKQAACVPFGAYVLDKSGNLIGNGSVADTLLPIKISKDTWDPKLLKKTDTTSQKIQLSFSWDITEKDEDIRMILSSESLIDLFTVRGLLDIYGDNLASVTTTGFVIDLIEFYGSAFNKNKIVGFVLADFTLFNETDNLAVTITSVTESPEGTYTFVFPAQTSADELELRSGKVGYDDAPLNTVTITIP